MSDDDCKPSAPCRRDTCVFCNPQEWIKHMYADGAMPGDEGYEETPEQTATQKALAKLVDSKGLDNLPDPEPLIGDDVVFLDSLVWMVGKPGCGKSFTALDMAGCVATGETWQGYRVTAGKVLYVVAEGVRGVKKRVRAWEKAMGREMTGVQFYPEAVQSKDDGAWAALLGMVREIRPTLIVLDTQARMTVGVEENSNAEMGVFVDKVERLRQASGACVLVVHHIGRNGDTGRGATTLDGAMSTVIKVTKDDDMMILECTKNKDGEEWEPIHLRMVPTGDSLILMPANTLAGRPAANTRWVREWWETFEGEWISITTLSDSGVIPRSTFHRLKLPFIKSGVIEVRGEGSTTRYRLPNVPA